VSAAKYAAKKRHLFDGVKAALTSSWDLFKYLRHLPVHVTTVDPSMTAN
jgi:hypothetical protein